MDCKLCQCWWRPCCISVWCLCCMVQEFLHQSELRRRPPLVSLMTWRRTSVMSTCVRASVWVDTTLTYEEPSGTLFRITSHKHMWNALTHTTEMLSQIEVKRSYVHYWNALIQTSKTRSHTRLKLSYMNNWNAVGKAIWKVDEIKWQQQNSETKSCGQVRQFPACIYIYIYIYKRRISDEHTLWLKQGLKYFKLSKRTCTSLCGAFLFLSYDRKAFLFNCNFHIHYWTVIVPNSISEHFSCVHEHILLVCVKAL